MRILFDHGTPRGLARYLTGHTVIEAIEQGWDQFSNGELLAAAEAAGFEVLVTPDKNLRYQQNLERRKIAIIVLGEQQWPKLKPHAALLVEAVNAATPGSLAEVNIPLE